MRRVGQSLRHSLGCRCRPFEATCSTTNLASFGTAVTTAGAAAAPASGELSQSEKLNLAPRRKRRAARTRQGSDSPDLTVKISEVNARLSSSVKARALSSPLQLGFQEGQLGLPSGHLAKA